MTSLIVGLLFCLIIFSSIILGLLIANNVLLSRAEKLNLRIEIKDKNIDELNNSNSELQDAFEKLNSYYNYTDSMVKDLVDAYSNFYHVQIAEMLSKRVSTDDPMLNRVVASASDCNEIFTKKSNEYNKMIALIGNEK